MLSTSTDVALAKMRDEVKALHAANGELRRVNRRLSTSQLALWFVIAVLVFASTDMYLGRNDARSYYNTQLQNLACLALHYTPPGTSFHSDLRVQYPNCPPYQSPTGPAVPHASPTRAHAAGRRVPRSTPAARPAVSRKGGPPRAVATSRAHSAPRPSPAPRATRSAARPTPTPTPLVSTPLVPGLLCTVVNLIARC